MTFPYVQNGKAGGNYVDLHGDGATRHILKVNCQEKRRKWSRS
jgi:hypothetical protein